MEEEKLLAASATANEILGYRGRLISGSKGQYRWDNPRNVVAFNANVCLPYGKIWHGDLDITVDEDKLKKLAEALSDTVYVLYESDARFEHEAAPLLEKAVWCSAAPVREEDYVRENGRLYHVEEEPPPPKTIVEYNERDWVYIKDFDKRTLTRSSKKYPPLHYFYEGIKDPTWKSEDYHGLYMSYEARNTMRAACEAWFRRWHDYLTEYRIQSNLGWLMFDAPLHFENHVPWVKEFGLYKRRKDAA